jgi:hypothetical protein
MRAPLSKARALARLAGAALALRIVFASTEARAQAAPPAGHEDQAFDIMNFLAQRNLHDVHDEDWNVYGRFTYASSWKLPFSAPYTNLHGSVNSLGPDAERSFTGAFTLYFGLRLWQGAEAYFAPEVISERGFSNLKGIGSAIQNSELQKNGSETPQAYRARAYLRQTLSFGGKRTAIDSDPMQLAYTRDSRRLVLTAGNFTVLDVFDHNSVTWDPHRTFLNMAFMTHSSWDFAADARGYSWGAAAELYWDDWAVRIGRMAPPQNPNVLPVDLEIYRHYSDALEVEHDHTLFGQSGAVRLLAYRNYEVTGRFDDAIAAYQADPIHKNAANCPAGSYNYLSGNATAPDFCFVRKPNSKVGIGINVEQHFISEDIGVFLRAMYSDGETEVDAFNPADRDLSFGVVVRGATWRRPFDVAGIGYAVGWISDVHAQFLAMGGVDGFVGDGALRKAPESVFDVFYGFNLLKAIWLTADYQRLWNPGFNADRGPVDILSGRVHAEF